jgi:hypothetical protein
LSSQQSQDPPLATNVKKESPPPPEIWSWTEEWFPKIKAYAGQASDEEIMAKLSMEIFNRRHSTGLNQDQFLLFANTFPQQATPSWASPSHQVSSQPQLYSQHRYETNTMLSSGDYNQLGSYSSPFNDMTSSFHASSDTSVFRQHNGYSGSIPSLGSTPRLQTAVSINPQMLHYQVFQTTVPSDD